MLGILVTVVCLTAAGVPPEKPSTGDELLIAIKAKEKEIAQEIAEEEARLPAAPGTWVQSNGGELSIRLLARPKQVGAKEVISLVAQIRNDRGSPITILRPFGDYFAAIIGEITLWSDRGKVKYTGGIPDYDLAAEAFIKLEAGEIATGIIQLTPDDFAGSDRPGIYTLRYDYDYLGEFEELVAKEGVEKPWRGHITSREVQVIKLDSNSKWPSYLFTVASQALSWFPFLFLFPLVFFLWIRWTARLRSRKLIRVVTEAKNESA